MTEKKTFKNVRKSYMDSKENLDSWYVEAGGKCAYFKFDEWDMEVTFTKKQPKPEVGGTCKLKDSQVFKNVEFLILAVDNDLVWVRQLNVTSYEDTGWIEPVSGITDVKPWQPA